MDHNFFVFFSFRYREVYNVICLRLGNNHIDHHIPADSLQNIFNDLHLYPSKSQGMCYFF